MRGHIRQQGRGSWELKFDTGRDVTTGKRRIRYVTVRGNKRKAEAELARYLSQVGDNSYLEPSKLTVTDFLEQWLRDHAKHRVSAKTFERYSEIVRNHLIPGVGMHLLLKLAPAQIQGHHSATLTATRRRSRPDGRVIEKPPLSARTVKHHHRVLSQALKQAVRMRIIARNPADDVDPPRPINREMRTLDPAQSGALLKAIAGTQISCPVMLALTTGMRRGEILALRWKDIDLEKRSLSVSQTLEETRGGLTFKKPKTERSRRTISLPLLTIEELRRHRARQAEALLALGIRPAGDALVCCQADGTPLRPRNVTKAFAVVVRRLKFGVRFHDLRHTHISHLLAAGVHPKVASERAGHASVSITLDVYSHLIPGMQEDAANRIDAALRTHLER